VEMAMPDKAGHSAVRSLNAASLGVQLGVLSTLQFSTD
jgi:hypothetical protein